MLRLRYQSKMLSICNGSPRYASHSMLSQHGIALCLPNKDYSYSGYYIRSNSYCYAENVSIRSSIVKQDIVKRTHLLVTLT